MARQAAYCQECGECEPKCSQKISIIAQLKETDAALGEGGRSAPFGLSPSPLSLRVGA